MWSDRVFGGKKKELGGESIMPGQWVYVGAEEKREGLHVKRGEQLVGGEEGICPVIGFHRAFDRTETPDEDEGRSLRRYRERAKEAQKEGWIGWVRLPLLMEIHLEDLEETALEREIRQGMGALEAICRQPRTSLRQDEERLLVSRCKRPSLKAAMVLAAHSEDWESRTIWGGVRPKKIVGLVREEELEIYENRLVAGLVKRLKAYCEERRRAFERLHRLLEQKEDYQILLEESHYRRQQRLTTLWGGAWEKEEEAQKKAAKEGRERLSKMLRRLRGLEDSALMRGLQKRNEGGLVFRETNVLLHDELYRKAGRLWKAWEKWKQQISPSIQESWKKEQEAAEGYDGYAWALLLHTLEALGYKPHDEAEYHKANGTVLKGPTGQIKIARSEMGFELRGTGSLINCRVVPMAAHVGGSLKSESWCKSVWQRTRQGDQVLVLYLPSDEPKLPIETKRRIESLGKEGDGEGAMFIKAAPWDLESLERLMRALRWVLWEPFFKRYPICVELPDAWKEVSLPKGFSREGKLVRLECPQDEQDTEKLHRWVEAQKNQLEVTKDEIKKAKNQGDRKHLRQQSTVQEEKTKSAEDGWKTLREGNNYLRQLLRCPTCLTEAQSHQFQGRQETFRCGCEGCKSTWGTEVCKACKKKYVFLDFPKNPKVALEDLANGKAERGRLFGGDVLSLPLTGEEAKFLCSNCGGKGG